MFSAFVLLWPALLPQKSEDTKPHESA